MKTMSEFLKRYAVTENDIKNFKANFILEHNKVLEDNKVKMIRRLIKSLDVPNKSNIKTSMKKGLGVNEKITDKLLDKYENVEWVTKNEKIECIGEKEDDLSEPQQILTPRGLRLDRVFDMFNTKCTRNEDGYYVGSRNIVVEGIKVNATITSAGQLTPDHRSLFDFAVSQRNLHPKDKVVFFTLNEYLEVCKKDTLQHFHRQRVLQLVNDLSTVNLDLVCGKYERSYSFVAATQWAADIGEITFVLSKKNLDRYFEDFGTGYINISQTSPLRSGDLKTLVSFLQLNGEPDWINRFTIAQIRVYMNWDNKSPEVIISTITRLLKKGQKEVSNFPQYTRKKTPDEEYIWVKD